MLIWNATLWIDNVVLTNGCLNVHVYPHIKIPWFNYVTQHCYGNVISHVMILKASYNKRKSGLSIDPWGTPYVYVLCEAIPYVIGQSLTYAWFNIFLIYFWSMFPFIFNVFLLMLISRLMSKLDIECNIYICIMLLRY